MEDGLGSRRQRGWHEAQLDEGAHVDGQQEIDDAVRVEKGVNQPVLLPHSRTDVIRQQTVEADVPKPELLMTAFELRLPVRAQRERSIPTVCSQQCGSRERRADRSQMNSMDVTPTPDIRAGSPLMSN
jgi:hypothetical protein